MIYLLIVFCIWERQIQTDWMGGSGVQGPVTNWNTQYYEKDSVSTANKGQVSLIATSWDYTSTGWVKHVVENNSGILPLEQGFMPADINGDGIKDLVAHSYNEVVWYENAGSYNFTKRVIGSANCGTSVSACVHPCDIDKDEDIDVLVATADIGLGWFENMGNGASWTYHIQDSSIGYHSVWAGDMGLDGDMDMVAVDNSGGEFFGDIYLFRNNGSQIFNKELIKNFSTNDGYRVYVDDFNNDKYPDIYCGCWYVYVFLNDGTGNFTQSFYTDSVGMIDGTWASDIDMDGDKDIICNASNTWGILNNGTGNNFDVRILMNTPSDYRDVLTVGDIDLDGFPDIAEALYRVGWFRQDPNNPLTFITYDMDAITYGSSHWLYIASLNDKCMPSMDILVSGTDEHIVYENKMLKSFAHSGGFTSSILMLSDTLKKLKYFGWKACVPGDSTLAFWCRADTSSVGINSTGWTGPYYATKNIDSIALNPAPCVRYFQYKVDFTSKDILIDVPVLYEVSVSYDTCEGGYVEETKTIPKLSLEIIGNKIVLSSSKRLTNAELCIYNIAGEFVQTLYKGELESKKYTFTPELKRKGIYLVVCKYDGNTKTVKFVKLR
ncbi:MAG: T9SS type A sorting domain-containing protein [bacterium]|nr:T9SS type A sorting domain-containing protein [bacterium]